MKNLNNNINKIEYLSVVDQNNQIITKATRQEVHNNNLYHRASHIFIAYNNLIFLQLRANNKDQFPNKWDTSAAGHVLYQESYEQALYRELKEELDIDLDISDQKLKAISDISASKQNGYEFLRLFYYRFSDLPKITLELEEITTGGWFDIEHINYWLKTNPQDFAGCFADIWWQFLNYTKLTP